MTTPEDRAKKVVDDIMQAIMDRIMVNGEPIMSVDILNPAPALISQALRQAEDEAYERAARAACLASRGMSCFVGLDECQMFNQGVHAAEQAVLALKSEQGTKQAPAHPEPPPPTETPDQRVERIRRTPNRYFSNL